MLGLSFLIVGGGGLDILGDLCIVVGSPLNGALGLGGGGLDTLGYCLVSFGESTFAPVSCTAAFIAPVSFGVLSIGCDEVSCSVCSIIALLIFS